MDISSLRTEFIQNLSKVSENIKGNGYRHEMEVLKNLKYKEALKCVLKVLEFQAS